MKEATIRREEKHKFWLRSVPFVSKLLSFFLPSFFTIFLSFHHNILHLYLSVITELSLQRNLAFLTVLIRDWLRLTRLH